MLLFENCRELSFQVNSANLLTVIYAKWNKSPKISGSCKGNILNQFLFCFDDKKVTPSARMCGQKGECSREGKKESARGHMYCQVYGSHFP